MGVDTSTRSLILDDCEAGIFRVNRRALTAADLAEKEQQLVFDRSWLYVGHESELPERGDYHRRIVAGRPVVFIRSHDGVVRVLLNSCSHRGAVVCRQDSGNAKRFQCFYHGWTFDSCGDLVNVPGPDAYGPGFDVDALGLLQAPRCESYRGLYFVSFSEEMPSLVDYLEGVRHLLDLTLDSADVLGGWEVMKGATRLSVQANWKLLVENSIDMYHFPTVHQTYTQYMAKRRKQVGDSGSAQPQVAGSYSFSSPNGHGGFIHRAAGRPLATESPLWPEALNDEVRRLRERLVGQFGEDRGLAMAHESRHMLIYPNVLLQDSATGVRIRQIWPTSATSMDVLQWEFRPSRELPEMTERRLEGTRAFLGPGGFATPDDIEALESCQQGYAATPSGWNDVSRRMKDGPTDVADSEEQMRGFWRRWASQVEAP